jgi:hypothetical protein
MDKRLMQLAGLLKEGQEPPKEEGGGNMNPVKILKRFIPNIKLTDGLISKMIYHANKNSLKGEKGLRKAYKDAINDINKKGSLEVIKELEADQVKAILYLLGILGFLGGFFGIWIPYAKKWAESPEGKAYIERENQRQKEWEEDDARTTWVTCPKCQGRGVLGKYNNECDKCDGQGEVSKYR